MSEKYNPIGDVPGLVPVLGRGGKRLKAALAIVVLGGLSAPLAGAALAQENFYEGKQITMIVGSAPGGSYDAYVRLVARFLPRYIPGNPDAIVQNMPGAGGLQAATYMYNIAPKDGTVIAAAQSSVPTAPLLSPDVAQFDSNAFSWLGSITSEPYVGYVWKTSPVQSFEEAKTTAVTMGGTSYGTAGVDYLIISNAWFGTKFNLVSGYPGTGDVKLAMESGEVNGTFANNLTSLRLQTPEWITDGLVKIIVQHGLTPHPDLPGVPLFIDQATTDEQRQALQLLLVGQEFAKPYFAPPDIPADRLEILRTAFDAMVSDPEFVAEAEAINLSVESPMTGQELADLIRVTSETPQSVMDMIEEALSAYRNGAR